MARASLESEAADGDPQGARIARGMKRRVAMDGDFGAAGGSGRQIPGQGLPAGLGNVLGVERLTVERNGHVHRAIVLDEGCAGQHA